MHTSLRDIRRISPIRASVGTRSGALDAATSPPDGHAVGRSDVPWGMQKKEVVSCEGIEPSATRYLV